jgi:segregation and condensation protein B
MAERQSHRIAICTREKALARSVTLPHLYPARPHAQRESRPHTRSPNSPLLRRDLGSMSRTTLAFMSETVVESAVENAAAGPGVVGAAAGAVPSELAGRLEAILLSTERALPQERLAAALRLIRLDEDHADDDGNTPKAKGQKPSTPAAIAAACEKVTAGVAELNAAYEATGRSFRIEKIAGGYRIMTLPKFAETIAEFHRSRMSGKLTRPAIETLAIIAYKQPITRAQLEAIRGVSCGEVLKSLMERRLVTVRGRAEELGRPMLYGTTKLFLDQFGLSSIKDLPTSGDLRPAD